MSNFKELFSGKRFLLVIAGLVLLTTLVLLIPPKVKTNVSKKVEVINKEQEVISEITPPKIPSALPGSSVSIISSPGLVSELFSSFPKTVDLYEIASTSAIPAPEELAQRFGFLGKGKDEGLGVTLWVAYKKIFRFDHRENSFSYSLMMPPKNGDLTIDQLKNAAYLNLTQSGLVKKEEIALLSWDYQSGGLSTAGRVDSLNSADRVIFNFAPVVSNLPVFVGTNSLVPTEVVLDRAGNLLSLQHRLFNYQIKKVASPITKDFTTASRELIEGRGKLAGVEGPSVGTISIESASLSGVQLAYLFPNPGDKYLIPVFVFKGQAPLPDRRLAEATILLWAVAGIK